MGEKNSKQAALPMGTTPSPSDRVAVMIERDTAERAADFYGRGGTRSFDEAIERLLSVALDAVDIARYAVTDGGSDAKVVEAVVEAPKPTRTGDVIIGEVARKIAEHTIACGAGFWTGGVPEVRAALGVDADGQTIAAAFRRIERGQVAGVGATQCPQNYRAGGSYALWTVAAAPKRSAA